MRDSMSAFFLGLCAGLVSGAMLFVAVANTNWREEAIEHGAAHYDAVTGEFQWNEPGETK